MCWLAPFDVAKSVKTMDINLTTLRLTRLIFLSTCVLTLLSLPSLVQSDDSNADKQYNNTSFTIGQLAEKITKSTGIVIEISSDLENKIIYFSDNPIFTTSEVKRLLKSFNKISYYNTHGQLEKIVVINTSLNSTFIVNKRGFKDVKAVIHPVNVNHSQLITAELDENQLLDINMDSIFDEESVESVDIDRQSIDINIVTVDPATIQSTSIAPSTIESTDMDVSYINQ